MNIQEKINNYLNEAKSPSIEQMAKEISNNIDIHSEIYRAVKEYFEGDIILSSDDLSKLYKKIGDKLKRELR